MGETCWCISFLVCVWGVCFLRRNISWLPVMWPPLWGEKRWMRPSPGLLVPQSSASQEFLPFPGLWPLFFLRSSKNGVGVEACIFPTYEVLCKVLTITPGFSSCHRWGTEAPGGEAAHRVPGLWVAGLLRCSLRCSALTCSSPCKSADNPCLLGSGLSSRLRGCGRDRAARRFKTQPSELGRSGFECQLCHFQALCSWASDFTSLSLS